MMTINTLYELVRNSVEKFASKVAFSMYEGDDVTYAEVGRRIARVQEILTGAGLRAGDKVALLSSNMPNWCVSYLAVTSAGMVAVPILPDFSGEELDMIIAHSEAKALLVSDRLFTKLSKQTIERLETLGKYGSASKHRSLLSRLSQFRSLNIRFDEIDLAYLHDFELFLRKEGNTNNSIATKYAIFKAAYNKALAEGLFVPKTTPFTKYKVGSLWTRTRKRAITKEDIQKLVALEIAPNYRTDYAEFARDIFLFSYYTAGINFTDIATLRYCDIVDGRIYYSRHKTQKLLSFQLVPNAMRIIEKYSKANHAQEDYIFPILDRTEHKTAQQIFNRTHKVLRKVNRELKTLGEQIGLEMPLTTYVARHTFATVLKRSGVNIAIISESLGHSDLSTTQIYLDSFENSQIDAAMQHLL